jgi:hypothetical protein
MGRLPEAWIAPAEVRELRELTRYRCRLVGLRTSCRNQVHGVLGKLGVPVTCSDIFGAAGPAWLDGLGLPQPYAGKVTSLRQLAGELTTEITMLSEVIADLLAGHRGYQVIQQLPGIGPVLAAVIVAETGDVRRFHTAAQLCSWAGLTPAPETPGDGTDHKQIAPAPPGSHSRSHIMWRADRPPQGRLRRRYAAGLRPVLDPPARSPRTRQLPGTGTGSSARPPPPPKPAKPPIDTAPLLQG